MDLIDRVERLFEGNRIVPDRIAIHPANRTVIDEGKEALEAKAQELVQHDVMQRDGSYTGADAGWMSRLPEPVSSKLDHAYRWCKHAMIRRELSDTITRYAMLDALGRIYDSHASRDEPLDDAIVRVVVIDYGTLEAMYSRYKKRLGGHRTERGFDAMIRELHKDLRQRSYSYSADRENAAAE